MGVNRKQKLKYSCDLKLNYNLNIQKKTNHANSVIKRYKSSSYNRWKFWCNSERELFFLFTPLFYLNYSLIYLI